MRVGRWVSVAFGALFIVAFGTFAGGSALMSGSPQAGLPVMAATAPVVEAIGILGFGLLWQRLPLVAASYLGSRLFEAALLAVSAVLLHASLSLPQLAAASNTAYLIAMAVLGLGSLPLCAGLLRQRLIPAWLALWGLVGYAVFALGMIAELSGFPLGPFALALGGLFELAFGLWMMVFGFAPAPAQATGTGAAAAI